MPSRDSRPCLPVTARAAPSTPRRAISRSRFHAPIHSATRLGLSAEDVTLDGVEAIDVSAVDDSMEGHSYFSDRRELLQDLHTLFTQGQGAPRFGIKRLEGGAFAFKG